MTSGGVSLRMEGGELMGTSQESDVRSDEIEAQMSDDIKEEEREKEERAGRRRWRGIPRDVCFIVGQEGNLELSDHGLDRISDLIMTVWPQLSSVHVSVQIRDGSARIR